MIARILSVTWDGGTIALLHGTDTHNEPITIAGDWRLSTNLAEVITAEGYADVEYEGWQVL